MCASTSMCVYTIFIGRHLIGIARYSHYYLSTFTFFFYGKNLCDAMRCTTSCSSCKFWQLVCRSVIVWRQYNVSSGIFIQQSVCMLCIQCIYIYYTVAVALAWLSTHRRAHTQALENNRIKCSIYTLYSGSIVHNGTLTDDSDSSPRWNSIC